MKRALLVCVVAVAAVILFVGLRSNDSGGEGGAPAPRPKGSGAPPADGRGPSPLPHLPPVNDAELDEGLTPEQRRAMRRLIQTYRRAREMVEEVESSEAVRRRAQAGPEAEERYGTDREGIQGAIRSKIPVVKECYESWLAINPDLAGRIVTHFVIEASEEGDSARVVEVNIREGGLGNTFLEGCVLSIFSELEFEPPADGRIEVNYPFTFRAAPGEDTE